VVVSVGVSVALAVSVGLGVSVTVVVAASVAVGAGGVSVAVGGGVSVGVGPTPSPPLHGGEKKSGQQSWNSTQSRSQKHPPGASPPHASGAAQPQSAAQLAGVSPLLQNVSPQTAGPPPIAGAGAMTIGTAITTTSASRWRMWWRQRTAAEFMDAPSA
jgi:hypothetical protein